MTLRTIVGWFWKEICTMDAFENTESLLLREKLMGAVIL